MLDYVFRGGTVIDGTGDASFKADLGIKDGKIAVIGTCLKHDAKQVIDVAGLAISPGFIDFHSHSDTSFLVDDRCESKIYQGVTTELSGQCGSTIYPCPENRLENIRTFAGEYVAEFVSNSFQAFLDMVRIENKKMSTNLVPLIGHGALRAGVMGFDDRKRRLMNLSKCKICWTGICGRAPGVFPWG